MRPPKPRGAAAAQPPPLGKQRSVADLQALRRFTPGRFVRSVAGILKIVIILLFLAAAVSFLATGRCALTPDWYVWLYPLAAFLTAVLTICTYVFFVLGVAEDSPSNWVKADLVIITGETGLTVGVAIATLSYCSESSAVIFGTLALVGALMVAGSGGALYMMWRYRKEESPTEVDRPPVDRLRSKSILI